MVSRISARRVALVVAGFGAGAVAVILAGVPGGGMVHAQTAPPPGAYGPAPGPYGPAPGAYAPYDVPPPRGGGGGPVDDGAAIRMLTARGFNNVSVVRRRGPTLVLEANGPRGERVQVIVDALSGAINGMKVIGFGDQRY